MLTTKVTSHLHPLASAAPGYLLGIKRHYLLRETFSTLLRGNFQRFIVIANCERRRVIGFLRTRCPTLRIAFVCGRGCTSAGGVCSL